MDKSPKEQYQLAYRLVRLREYELQTYEQWDYAHYPSDEEVDAADYRWQVVQDCQRQRAEIEPLLAGSPLVAVALQCWLHRNDHIPHPKLAHLANNFGLAPWTMKPWRSDERDWYIGHYSWNLPWRKNTGAWRPDQRKKFLSRACEIIKSGR